jgi:hypothetical protein
MFLKRSIIFVRSTPPNAPGFWQMSNVVHYRTIFKPVTNFANNVIQGTSDTVNFVGDTIISGVEGTVESVSNTIGTTKDMVIDTATLPAVKTVKRIREQLREDGQYHTDVTVSINIGVMSVTLVNKDYRTMDDIKYENAVKPVPIKIAQW